MFTEPCHAPARERFTQVAEAWGHRVPRWTVVETIPNWERKVRFKLADQGYTVFLPVYLKLTRHARRVRTVQAPYFPRYLFVELEPGITPFGPIRNTNGVLQMLCDVGGRPFYVPPGIVEELQRQSAANGGSIPIEGLTPTPGKSRFISGDRIKVTEGSFTSIEGIFDREAGKRVVVLLSMFRGGTVEVELDEAQLKPAGN